MRSSPRSGGRGWTRSCASRGSTPGNPARTMTNDDRPRRGHRFVPLAGDGDDGLGGGSGHHRVHRARRIQDPHEQWVRDTRPRFGERGGRGQADGDAVRKRDAFGSEPESALPVAEHDGVSVASSRSNEARRGCNAPDGEGTRDPCDPGGRRPQSCGPDDDGGARAPRTADDGEDNDDDGDGWGPITRRRPNRVPPAGARCPGRRRSLREPVSPGRPRVSSSPGR